MRDVTLLQPPSSPVTKCHAWHNPPTLKRDVIFE